MDLGIQGNRVLVTGGASGIGLASAKAFAAEGCNVWLWDISPHVTQAASEIESEFSVEVSGTVIDMLDWEAAVKVLEKFTQTGATIDHVVHSAAIGSGKFGFPFTNLAPKDWGRTLEINILGMVNVAHLLTPIFTAQGRGTFVFIASVAGQIGSQTDPPYSASKAANINFAQCMAKDLAGQGIRVNTVCPGMVQTPLNRSVWQAWHNGISEAERLTYEQWAQKKIENIVPLKRWQTSEDIASMIVFLSSKRASQVTGQTVNVDGGFVMHW